MLTSNSVRHVKQSRVFDRAKAFHAVVAVPACRVAHGAVVGLPANIVPANLALKHYYDHVTISVSPQAIRHSLPAGNWRRGRSAATSPSRLAEMLRWYTHGGAWKTVKRHPSRNFQGRFVLGGNWDVNKRDFEVRPTVMQLFVDGALPHETTEYQKMRRWVEAGNYRWTKGCTSMADIDRYFVQLIEAFEGIRRHGYCTQEELGNAGGDEIRVCVDRDGRWCVIGGGTHRLSMAKVLDLDGVPVLVKRVHAEWVAKCKAQFGGRTADAIAAGLADLSLQR